MEIKDIKGIETNDLLFALKIMELLGFSSMNIENFEKTDEQYRIDLRDKMFNSHVKLTFSATLPQAIVTKQEYEYSDGTRKTAYSTITKVATMDSKYIYLVQKINDNGDEAPKIFMSALYEGDFYMPYTRSHIEGDFLEIKTPIQRKRD